MNTNDLVDAMNSLDDDIITECRKPVSVPSKRLRFIRPVIAITAVAACAVLIIVVLSITKKDNIVYADEFMAGELLNMNEKVNISESILKLGKQTQARVAIAVHGLVAAENEYPEYGFKWENGTHSTGYKDFYAFTDYVMDKELEFFKSIGAKDCSKLNRSTIVCTMTVNAIKKLENGKLRYTVVLYTLNDESVKIDDLSAYTGEYDSLICVYRSLLSSFASANHGYLHLSINGDHASLYTTEEYYDFLHIKHYNYRCEKKTEEDLSFRGKAYLNPNSFGTNITLDLGCDAVYLNELLYSPRTIYVAYGPEGNAAFKIIITPDGIYVDTGGSVGIYKFR